MSAEPLLTDAEHALIEALGDCAGAYKAILAADPRRAGALRDYAYDLTEFVDKVHQLQHTVMARAAARAYPTRYRP